MFKNELPSQQTIGKPFTRPQMKGCMPFLFNSTALGHSATGLQTPGFPITGKLQLSPTKKLRNHLH